jgi:hypothetical protein
MKVIEGNPDSALNKWPLLLDTDSIKSVGIAWLFKENGEWKFAPRITGNTSLFYNAVFFLRLSLPLGIFGSFRWSPATDKKALFQTGFGWKLNGRFGITLRIQSDAASAAGTAGPNYGQATGFDYGTH